MGTLVINNALPLLKGAAAVGYALLKVYYKPTFPV